MYRFRLEEGARRKQRAGAPSASERPAGGATALTDERGIYSRAGLSKPCSPANTPLAGPLRTFTSSTPALRG